jgi:MFS family permease
MRKTIPEDYGLLPDGDASVTTEYHSEITIDNEPNVSLTFVIKNPAFWIMALCFSMGIMVEMMAFVHQVVYAMNIHIEKIAAASSLGLVGVGSIFGRFFFGWLCDVLKDPKYSVSLGLLTMAAGMLILLNVSSVTALYTYSLVFGFGYGSIAPTVPILVSDRFGRKILGSIFGLVIFFATGIGGGLGPIIGGLIYDKFGSYVFAWQLGLITLFVASVLILTIKPKK